MNTSFNYTDNFVNEYLKVIKYNEGLNLDINTLRELHKNHILNVPFENLNIFLNEPIELHRDKLWNKIVRDKRGGLCYELNGLFFYLLNYIGFNAKYLSAQVSNLGDEYDHVLLSVVLDEDLWLLDVGFGGSFLYPIKFVLNEVQQDVKGYYKIVKTKDKRYELLRSRDNEVYSTQYIFNLKERSLGEFKEKCRWFETSPISRFRKYRLCNIETEDGWISLKDDKLTISNGKNVIEKTIVSDIDFKENLKKLFNIEI